MGDVKIPKGLKEGDSFIFEMSVPDETAVKEAHKARADSASTAAGGGPGGTGTATTSSQGRGFLDRFRHEWNRTAYITSPEGCGFLDREIVDTRDFIAALGVGMLIGVSIVSGFLVGVLMVTEPDL